MSAGLFALLVIAVLLVLASAPLFYAHHAGSLFASDFGLLLLPVPAFVIGLAFNGPAHVGWAGIAYPFLVLALAVVALYLRVFLLPRLGVSPRISSLAMLIAALAGAAAFGALTPPFYE